MTTAAARVPTTPTRENPAYQAYLILRAGFVVAPILFGLDKFTNLLADWTIYLAPRRRPPGPGQRFQRDAGHRRGRGRRRAGRGRSAQGRRLSGRPLAGRHHRQPAAARRPLRRRPAGLRPAGGRAGPGPARHPIPAYPPRPPALRGRRGAASPPRLPGPPARPARTERQQVGGVAAAPTPARLHATITTSQRTRRVRCC